MSHRFTRLSIRLALRGWVALALLIGASTASGQGLAVAADDGHLWVMLPQTDRPGDKPGVLTLLHHGPGDPTNQLSKVASIRGEVDPLGVAARAQTLWMIYTDGTIQSFLAVPTPLKDGWVYRRRVEQSLPAGVSVRAMALTDAGPWVLVRVEDAQGLEAIRSTAEPKGSVALSDQARRSRNIALGLPLDYKIDRNPSEAPPTADTDSKPDTTRTTIPLAFPVDRLLCFKRGKWRMDPLPDGWAHGAPAWLIRERPKSQRPTLATLARDADAPSTNRVEVYRWETGEDLSWVQQTYTPRARASVEGFALIGVEGQLVLAELSREDSARSASLWVLRGGKTLPVGRMSLQSQEPEAWSLLSLGNTVALIVQNPVTQGDDPKHPGHGLSWTRMDLRGNTMLDPTDLTVKTRSPMDDFAQYAGLVIVVVLVSLLMLTFWQRDSDWNRLELPDELIVAELGRRVFAAGIDLAPGLLGVMFYFGLSIDELTLRWPGNGLARTFQQMLPGALVIFVFVSHTTISELIFARTLGKALTGLRTANLDGTRPKARQLLVRGLMKILDLLPFAWLLLVLPVIAPHRQRLGDLVARTVVVSNAPKEESADADEDKDEGKDEGKDKDDQDDSATSA